MNTYTVSETLNKTADLLEEKGWVNGAEGWTNALGRGFCLEGALAAVLGIEIATTDHREGTTWVDRNWDKEQEMMACPSYTAMQSYVNDDARLYGYNDAHTKTEVIEALRACAVIEEAKEKEMVAA